MELNVDPARTEVRCIEHEAGLRAIWPVLRQLRPHLDEAGFLALARTQFAEGWRCHALYVDGVPRAVAGWRMLTKLAVGRHVYVDDLVTDEAHRGAGYGSTLLRWLLSEARRLGCVRLQLDSGTHRREAHAFYFAHGLRIESFHFGVALDAAGD